MKETTELRLTFDNEGGLKLEVIIDGRVIRTLNGSMIGVVMRLGMGELTALQASCGYVLATIDRAIVTVREGRVAELLVEAGLPLEHPDDPPMKH